MSRKAISRAHEQQEEWRPVVGYEGVYEVSSLGPVRRVGWASGVRLGRILKQRIGFGGYPVVRLTREWISKTCYVHQLVAAAFLGPRPEGWEVNHKDRDRTNPAASNLEYLTHSDNLRYSYRNGAVAVRGEGKLNAKLVEAQIREIRASDETIMQIKRRFGICYTHARNIRLGLKWRHILPETGSTDSPRRPAGGGGADGR